VPVGKLEIATVQVSLGCAEAVLPDKGMTHHAAPLTSGGTVRLWIDMPAAPHYILSASSAQAFLPWQVSPQAAGAAVIR
jgi:hypothetical protein